MGVSGCLDEIGFAVIRIVVILITCGTDYLELAIRWIKTTAI